MTPLMEAPLGAATFRSVIVQPIADTRGSLHAHATLNSQGRAAVVVLNNGAASHGPGNAGMEKEKSVRWWLSTKTRSDPTL